MPAHKYLNMNMYFTWPLVSFKFCINVVLFPSSFVYFCYSVKAVWPCGQIMQGEEVRELSLSDKLFSSVVPRLYPDPLCPDYAQIIPRSVVPRFAQKTFSTVWWKLAPPGWYGWHVFATLVGHSSSCVYSTEGCGEGESGMFALGKWENGCISKSQSHHHLVIVITTTTIIIPPPP